MGEFALAVDPSAEGLDRVFFFRLCVSFLCPRLQTGREDRGRAEVRSVSGAWHARHDQTAGSRNGAADAVCVYWL